MSGASDLTFTQPHLEKLTRDLDRLGRLFLEVARTRDGAALEQVLGGVAEWMGNDLLEGWLHLPIPLFEDVSGLAEELFRACEAYLLWTRQAPRSTPDEGRAAHEGRIQAVLERVRALEGRDKEAGGGENRREA